MSSLLTSLSAQQLRQAAKLKDQIQSLEKQLHGLLALPTKSTTKAPAKKKFKMSAATKAKIAAAAKARWAKVKASKK
jgi:hypothetical protein